MKTQGAMQGRHIKVSQLEWLASGNHHQHHLNFLLCVSVNGACREVINHYLSNCWNFAVYAGIQDCFEGKGFETSMSSLRVKQPMGDKREHRTVTKSNAHFQSRTKKNLTAHSTLSHVHDSLTLCFHDLYNAQILYPQQLDGVQVCMHKNIWCLLKYIEQLLRKNFLQPKIPTDGTPRNG